MSTFALGDSSAIADFYFLISMATFIVSLDTELADAPINKLERLDLKDTAMRVFC
jgi:hypothetical protein